MAVSAGSSLISYSYRKNRIKAFQSIPEMQGLQQPFQPLLRALQ